MTLDKRLEARLFDSSDKQTTGINFDNYDKIPIEVSGQNVPEPIDSYSVETIGEDLFRNTQLCGYSKPTSVQKYSVPIGQHIINLQFVGKKQVALYTDERSSIPPQDETNVTM
jgi:hypothetical protein